MKTPPSSLLLVALIGTVLSSEVRADPPTLTEPGWSLAVTLPASEGSAPSFGNAPDELYYGRYLPDGDIFRRTVDGRTRKVTDTTEVSGLVVAPDGDLFFAEITGGDIFRVDALTGVEEIWISDLHPGDDDPVGLALVPADYVGPSVLPGEIVVTDVGLGYGNVEEVYAFSSDQPASLRVLHADDGTLGNPSDVTVVPGLGVYVTDQSHDALYRISGDGRAVPQVVTPPLGAPVGLTVDRADGTLIVANQDTGTLVRLTAGVDPETWSGELLGSGFDFSRPNTFQAVRLRADGSQLVVASREALYIFDNCVAGAVPTIPDCNDNGVFDLCELRSGQSSDCDANGRPDACDLAAGADADCDFNGIPDRCAVCDKLDLVFVVDTSTSMTDEADVLCSRLSELGAALSWRGLSANIELLGISEAPGGVFDCLGGDVIDRFGTAVPGEPDPTQSTLGACPGGNAIASEDWGRATSVVAANYPWTEGAVRLVIPLSDEGPWCGDPVTDPGVDREATLRAIAVAADNDVIVSPIITKGGNAQVLGLAELLANKTGGVARSSEAATTLTDDIIELVRAACFSDHDCNANQIPDICDVAAGTSQDCDGNSLPDECDVASGRDCNANDIPDSCDLGEGTSLDCDANARPDECPTCPSLDVLFVMDTSDSMNEEASALCQGVQQVVFELDRRGLDYRAQFFGIADNPGGVFGCLTGNVLAAYGAVVPGDPPLEVATMGDCPGGNENPTEDWGRGIAVAAANHAWLNGAVRLLVPIADEGPACGDPVSDPGIDRQSVEQALSVAKANGVVVSPIVPVERNPQIMPLVARLASGTGGEVFDLAEPDVDITGSMVASILSACDADYDCDADDIPDSCELASGAGVDCDDNGLLDSCDVARGVADCNENLIPDACEIALDPDADCDFDGNLDSCQVATGRRPDCNSNGVPDICDVTNGFSEDDGHDGVPDECQLIDCNGNQIHDTQDIASGHSLDCNANGRPDECDLVEPALVDMTFSVKSFGSPSEPGVVRDGFDNGSDDLLGYESRLPSNDPAAVFSSSGEMGSPLAGPYRADYGRTGLTVAITELMQEPSDGEASYEWIELYNYGGAAVSLEGWRLRDQGVDDVGLPAVSVPPGQFLLLARDPQRVARRWGLSESLIGVQVVAVDFGPLDDTGDELALWDGSNQLDWSLAWGDDGVLGASTYLSAKPVMLPVSADCDHNTVPDECQEDCNGNHVADICDLATGTSADCNSDDVPDECQLDCDGSGTPDDCDLATGAALDCNGNTIPDSCDIASGLSQDCDAGGIPDECQPDCNDNQLVDVCEIAQGTLTDCDGNTIPDVCEIAAGAGDCDDDGELDVCEIAAGAVDCDADGVPDLCEIAAGDEPDCDSDGRLDACELLAGTEQDCDDNQIPDSCQIEEGAGDCNDNDRLDVCEIAAGEQDDCDRNGVPDACEIASGAGDCDGDGKVDACEVNDGEETDCDGDWVPDRCQLEAGGFDCDGDDKIDLCEINAGNEADCDGDHVPDKCQVDDGTAGDCDGDELLDSCEIAEGAGDCDADGVPDSCQIEAGAAGDCDDDGVLDSCEIAEGASDCDNDDVPDSCQIDADGVGDCDGDEVLDRCEIADGAEDCDEDGVPDSCAIDDGAGDCDGDDTLDICEIARGVEADCDGDGTPDDCEIADGSEGDCDGDRVLDRCEIQAGADDCDGNGVPDACEINRGLVDDCDGDNRIDSCEIAEGTEEDCNGNQVPDRCELLVPGNDVDGNHILDACEGGDCNHNGVPDLTEIASGAANDCDGNGVPDICQGDCNGNGIIDACDDATEVCDGVDNDCDGLTDAEDGDMALVNCDAPECGGLTLASADLCVGGVWQPCHCDGDRDHDGVSDEGDNCPDTPNPLQSDIDEDGLGDACDEVDNGLSAQGGGGCAAGSSQGGGPLSWPLGLLGLWLLARTRKVSPSGVRHR